MSDFTQFLDVGGWRGSPSSESHFDQSPGLGLILPLLPFLIDMIRCIRDQCIYITRVGPHINVVQRDLSILSCPSPEQDSKLDAHSPSSPFVLFHYLFCPLHCQHG